MADLNRIGGLHYEMMKRCYDQKSVMWGTYGEKGITVCSEWHDRDNFRKWAHENGYVKGLRLNRIDNSKNYCPENCVLGNKNCKIAGGKNQEIKKKHKERIVKKEEAGISGRMVDDELYVTYQCMHSRCERKNHVSYNNYGGRGIFVCDEWSGKYGFLNFRKWSVENGWKSGLSLDRKDNNKNYSPENCKFSTRKEQNFNKRCNIYYEYCGISMPLGMIANIENVKYGMLYSRVRKKGMSIDEALTDIKECLK